MLYLIVSGIAPNSIRRPDAQSYKSGIWLVVYLIAMLVMSYVGSSTLGELKNYIHYPWDLVAVLVISLIFYYWGVASGYRTKDVDEALEAVIETRESGFNA